MIRLASDWGNFCLWAGAGLLLFMCLQYAILANWVRKPRKRPQLEGISITGLAAGIVVIYAPSLAALCGGPANFAATRWYFWLVVGTVTWIFVFAATLVWCWERARRQRRVSVTGRHE